MNACFYVYIMASKSRVLYIGITNNLRRRVWEHKNGLCSGFTRDYKVHRLVYFERFQYVQNAIQREKQLKGWLRRRKMALIETANPTWEDLAAEWYEPFETSSLAALGISPAGSDARKAAQLRFARDDNS